MMIFRILNCLVLFKLAKFMESANRYISSAKSVLDDLIAKAGFWVSGQLYARVLEAAGE
jgi:predicted nucleic acid-binding protein